MQTSVENMYYLQFLTVRLMKCMQIMKKWCPKWQYLTIIQLKKNHESKNLLYSDLGIVLTLALKMQNHNT